MESDIGTRKVSKSTKQKYVHQFQTSVFGLKCWLLLLLVLSFSIPSLAGLCPQGCQCENKGLFTVCPTGELKHVPHFLNPAIKQLKINGNRITKLEGALNFYDKVWTLNSTIFWIYAGIYIHKNNRNLKSFNFFFISAWATRPKQQ